MASNLSQFFPGGRFITDPTLLTRISKDATLISRGGQTSAAAAFWTGNAAAIDRIPGSVQDDTNWTADTYKTILSLSGQAGLVANFMGPTLPTAGDTNTWRITVDGAATVVVMTAQANASRCMLGLFAADELFTTLGSVMTYGGTPSDGLTGNAGNTIMAFSPLDLLAIGAGLLRFTNTLLVEAKISVNLTTTTNRERRSGVILQRTA